MEVIASQFVAVWAVGFGTVIVAADSAAPGVLALRNLFHVRGVLAELVEAQMVDHETGCAWADK